MCEKLRSVQLSHLHHAIHTLHLSVSYVNINRRVNQNQRMQGGGWAMLQGGEANQTHSPFKDWVSCKNHLLILTSLGSNLGGIFAFLWCFCYRIKVVWCWMSPDSDTTKVSCTTRYLYSIKRGSSQQSATWRSFCLAIIICIH